MIGRRSLVALTQLDVLGTGACAIYPQQAPPQAYLEVPCDMPGAFRADVRPLDWDAAYPPGTVARSASPYASPTAGLPGAQPLCLAKAEVVPPRYARRAYGYDNNGWSPYRSSGYFGFGLGVGHLGRGHFGGGHTGSRHFGGGHRH